MAACWSKSAFRVHSDEEPLLLLTGSCRTEALNDFLTLEKLSPTGALIGTGADKLVLLTALGLSANPFPATAENPPQLLLLSFFRSSSGVLELKSASDFWRLLVGLSELTSLDWW